MVERRGADLHLAARGRIAVRRKNQAQQFLLLLFQRGFVIFCIVFAFGGKTADDFVFLKPRFFRPCKLREELEVTPVPRRESYKSLRAAGRARPFVEFDKSRPARHQALLIDLERAQENFGLVFARELVGIFEREGKPGLVEFSASVLFELPSESRNQIERGMKFGKLAKRLRHAVVVLEGVQARPRQNITARFRVLVLRLMHVPQHNQMDAVHSEGVPKQGWH